MNDALTFSVLMLAVGAAVTAGLTIARRAQEHDTAERYTAVQTLERMVEDMSRRLAEVEVERQRDRTEQERLHQEMMRLHQELGRIGVRLDRWMAYAARLADIMREKGLDVPEAPEIQPPPQMRARPVLASQLRRAELMKLIAAAFSLDEVNGLAWELDLAAHMTGDGLEARARALVDVAQRNNKMIELVDLCRERRPNGGF